jgi:hypothetical protein
MFLAPVLEQARAAVRDRTLLTAVESQIGPLA